MLQNSSTPLLLVSGNRFTQRTLADQLHVLLPEEISIVPYLTDDPVPLAAGTYFAVFSSKEVYREFIAQNPSEDGDSQAALDAFVIAERTMLNQNIDQILTLPRNQRILLVNESKESTRESLQHLKKIGFDFLRLVPYYPGCPQPDRDIKIAITPGEIDKVPPGIDAVYNIGPRSFDFSTIVRILTYYGLLEDMIAGYTDRYLSNLVDFAKKLSNVADETSRVMTTVRTELIGSGHFAKYRFSDIIGQSRELLEAKAIAEKIARTGLNVLIEGDNGTGKELFSSAIHNASDRRRNPFIAINLSVLPDSLVESELFGYEEGAFTGARKKGKIGLFQQAAGGTIFLDEIGDISLKMQAKLLRVIQEREIMRVGGDRIIPVDVRIIAATNRDLMQMMEEKTFRKDLYYRLREGYLHLPSLASRREDIPMLIDYWQENLFHTAKQIDPQALQLLMSHDWPGNVRELLNLMKFVFAVCSEDTVTVSDLPFLRAETAEPASPLPEKNIGPAAVDLPPDMLDELSLAVLRTASQLQQEGILVGRNSLLCRMREQGAPLTEYRVRKCLQLLLRQNYLQSEQGRYGLFLTSKGSAFLSRHQ